MRAGQPSRTARQNALFRALEARRPAGDRVADDPLAVKFLTPEFRALAAAGRVPPARRLIESVIDRRWPCVRGGVVARTQLIDEAVAAALPAVQQALILGAGFDSRAYRLAQLRDVAVFEVDHPATQAAKRRILRRGSGAIPANVRFVPVEFGADDPAAKLAEGGFASGKPTLVLWEGSRTTSTRSRWMPCSASWRRRSRPARRCCSRTWTARCSTGRRPSRAPRPHCGRYGESANRSRSG